MRGILGVPLVVSALFLVKLSCYWELEVWRWFLRAASALLLDLDEERILLMGEKVYQQERHDHGADG